MKERMSVVSAIKRWGNSPALRLPLSLLQVAQFSPDQRVSVTAEKGRLTIEPVAKTDFDLGQLISAITEDNSPNLVDLGSPRGEELL
jgi:antitoxin MazE